VDFVIFVCKLKNTSNQKLVQQHECNIHETILFNSERQSFIFPYTKILVKKINIEKILKLLENHWLQNFKFDFAL